MKMLKEKHMKSINEKHMKLLNKKQGDRHKRTVPTDRPHRPSDSLPK